MRVLCAYEGAFHGIWVGGATSTGTRTGGCTAWCRRGDAPVGGQEKAGGRSVEAPATGRRGEERAPRLSVLPSVDTQNDRLIWERVGPSAASVHKSEWHSPIGLATPYSLRFLRSRRVLANERFPSTNLPAGTHSLPDGLIFPRPHPPHKGRKRASKTPSGRGRAKKCGLSPELGCRRISSHSTLFVRQTFVVWARECTPVLRRHVTDRPFMVSRDHLWVQVCTHLPPRTANTRNPH